MNYATDLDIIFESNIKVSGIIHCSGGGLTKSINFGKGITYVKDVIPTLKVPPIFKAIQDMREIDDYHMYQTFNMGIGMELILKDLNDVSRVVKYANKYNVNAYLIGHTENSPDGINRVEIGSSIYTKYK